MQLRFLVYVKSVIIFALIPLILSIGIAPNLAFGYFPGSPYDQLEKGVPIPEITCRGDRVLMVDLRGKPGCAFGQLHRFFFKIRDNHKSWIFNIKGIITKIENV